MAGKKQPAARKRVTKQKEITLRQALDAIDAVLVKDNEVAKNLWMVLSALRGPDETSQNQLKATGTVHIRAAAFPLTAAAARNGLGYSVGADFGNNLWGRPIQVPNKNVAYLAHFENHLWHAMNALGLVPAAAPPADPLVKDTTYDHSVDRS